MKSVTFAWIAALSLWLGISVHANTFGSVEPIATPAVIDTRPLLRQPLGVRETLARQILQCGAVDQVIDALSAARAITTINGLNARFEVAAGGFAGETNPAFVYTIIDSGPNAASLADIQVLTNSLGFVFSQNSAFLLDAANPSNLDFPANYVVLNFPAPPPIAQSAALFQIVGKIDNELFATDTSGYTQFGRAYLSLQSAVPDSQFISGYVKAAARMGLEYTPIVNGQPGLFQGGAAFPGNDWVQSPAGEEYLARIPAQSHKALRQLRAIQLRIMKEVVKKLDRGHHDRAGAVQLACQ